MRVRTGALLVLLATGGAPPARAQTDDNERYALRAEVGLEYDSNAHRAEIIAGALNPPVVGSALERVVVQGALSDVVAPGQAVALSATAAGKLFDAAAARDEDVAIAQSSASWRVRLAAPTTLALAGAYYEAFQSAAASLADADERRDFRSLAPRADVTEALGPAAELTIGAGYRWFVFKPDRDEDFAGPTAGAELRWQRLPDEGADWEITAGGGFEHRTFGGPALTAACAPPAGLLCSGADTRVDDLLSGHVDVTRTAGVLVGAGYAVQDNLSNSTTETVLRHVLSARVAAGLPLGMFVAARGELLLAYYRDPLPLTASTSICTACASIEDENRSNLRVDVSRDVAGGLRLLARYTVYANELGNNAGSYRRQTILFALAAAIEK